MHIGTQGPALFLNESAVRTVNLINDSVIKSVIAAMAVLVSFLKYNFSYLNN